MPHQVKPDRPAFEMKPAQDKKTGKIVWAKEWSMIINPYCRHCDSYLFRGHTWIEDEECPAFDKEDQV